VLQVILARGGAPQGYFLRGAGGGGRNGSPDRVIGTGYCMPIQLSTQSRLQVAKVRLQVAKVGFVSRDLPFREALSADCRRPLMADCCLKRPANGPGVVLNFLSSRLVCERYLERAGAFARSCGEPCGTIFPPASPPSGPMSMIQSASAMTSRLRSITTTLMAASPRGRGKNGSITSAVLPCYRGNEVLRPQPLPRLRILFRNPRT